VYSEEYTSTTAAYRELARECQRSPVVGRRRRVFWGRSFGHPGHEKRCYRLGFKAGESVMAGHLVYTIAYGLEDRKYIVVDCRPSGRRTMRLRST
jgi:hypothetical protein